MLADPVTRNRDQMRCLVGGPKRRAIHLGKMGLAVVASFSAVDQVPFGRET